MPSWLLSAVRTGVQIGWGYLAAWLLALGVNVPADAPVWLTGTAVALVTIAVTAVVRWMEDRPATSPVGRLCRWVGRWLMLRLPSPTTQV